MKLKFEGRYICDENGKELAQLSVREHVPADERYVVYLKDVVDYMGVSQLRELISAASQLQPASICQAGMISSFKTQLESKLHDCLMVSDKNYRQEFEISELRKQVKNLEKWLEEERVRRVRAEREVDSLLQRVKSLLNEDESESESEAESENE